MGTAQISAIDGESNGPGPDRAERRRAFIEEMRARRQGGYARAPIVPPTPGFLTPEHRARLERTMRPEIIAGRGYVSIGPENLSWLATQGYARYQFGVGLLSPLWPLTSVDDGHPISDCSQLRRDKPRLNNGGPGKPRQVVELETPADRISLLDVHPSNRDRLRDLYTELWVVSSDLVKADAGASRGMLVASLQGIWNWLGRDGCGGVSVALADFDQLELKKRMVNIVLDAESRAKKRVQDALMRVGSCLQERGAYVATCEIESGLEEYWANE